MELVGGLRGQSVDPPEPWSRGGKGRRGRRGSQGDPRGRQLGRLESRGHVARASLCLATNRGPTISRVWFSLSGFKSGSAFQTFEWKVSRKTVGFRRNLENLGWGWRPPSSSLPLRAPAGKDLGLVYISLNLASETLHVLFPLPGTLVPTPPRYALLVFRPHPGKAAWPPVWVEDLCQPSCFPRWCVSFCAPAACPPPWKLHESNGLSR